MDKRVELSSHDEKKKTNESNLLREAVTEGVPRLLQQ